MNTLSDNAYGYAEPIWQHFSRPNHAGEFPRGTPGVKSGQAGSAAARSVLRLQLRFDNGHVAEARFKAYGCPTSIAVGEWIAAWSLGRDAASLSTLSAATLREILEIPEDRAHCALMGEDALRAAVAAASTGVAA
jgi:NifU-like protein involved in Fe-S cluster formation